MAQKPIARNITAPTWPNIKDKPEVLSVDSELPSRHVLLRKSAAETRSSATLTIDTDLQVEVEANTVYEGTLVLQFLDSKDTPDFGFVYPSGAEIMGWFQAGNNVGSTALSTYVIDQTFTKEGVTGANRWGFVIGFVLVVGSTAGTFGIRWAKKTATTDSQMLKNSYVTLTKGV